MESLDDNIKRMTESIETLEEEIKKMDGVPSVLLRVVRMGYEISRAIVKVVTFMGEQVMDLTEKIEGMMSNFINAYARNMLRFSGMSESEVDRLITRWKETGDLELATYIVLRSILGALGSAVQTLSIAVPKVIDIFTRTISTQPSF